MTHAIAELQMALDTARHNEPIYRQEGRIDQADHAIQRAADLERAIHILETAMEAPDADFRD